MSEDLRFPIGKFDLATSLQNFDRETRIRSIANLPSKLDAALEGLDETQIDTEYRPEGWTVRQLVHHIADSHINSVTRFKLTLTEEKPTIQGYFEDRWAELPDSSESIRSSLDIIRGIHQRWTKLLLSMTDSDFEKELTHPESGDWTLDGMTALYDWHSRHHTAHITALRQRMNW